MEGKLLSTGGDAASIIETVAKLHNPVVVMVKDPETGLESPMVFAPDGLSACDVKTELDQWLESPRRLKGKATAGTLQSFCDLVNRHKTPDTAIFASSPDAPLLTSVIDYHERNGESGAGSAPSWCEHRISYAFPKTPQLIAWQQASGSMVSQQAFAQFLDLRRFELVDPLDIGTPDDGSIVQEVMLKATPRDKRIDASPSKTFAGPNEIMALVESLSASTRTKWSEAKTDRFGGIKVSSEREGKIETESSIPNLFLIELAPFVGGEKLVLPARIRATVTDNQLRLCAELIGLDRVLERGFVEALDVVQKATNLPVYRGTPEA